MAARYPGAIWKPCPDGGSMERIDGCTWHEAVTRAASLYGWVQTARACHLYNGKRGSCEQYIDVGRVAWGVADGNHRMLTVESYDGLQIEQNPYREIGEGGTYGSSANTGRWDPQQCERAADIMAWLSIEYGIPLRMMANSRPTEKGHAPHRWGIAPWRVSGGEVWTQHDGKPCPGDLRVQQLPGIVARAQVIAAAVRAGRCTWLPPGEVNIIAALARTGVTSGGGSGVPTPSNPDPDPGHEAPNPVQEDDDMPTAKEFVDELLARRIPVRDSLTTTPDQSYAIGDLLAKLVNYTSSDYSNRLSTQVSRDDLRAALRDPGNGDAIALRVWNTVITGTTQGAGAILGALFNRGTGATASKTTTTTSEEPQS